MARTKGKYTPNSCLQVHFQNKSVLACYLSLSLHPRTVQQMHMHDAFKDSSAVTHKALHQFIHIHHKYGSVTLAWHTLTLWRIWQLHECIWNIAISPLARPSKWGTACDYFFQVCEFYDWAFIGKARPFLRKAFWGDRFYLFKGYNAWEYQVPIKWK